MEGITIISVRNREATRVAIEQRRLVYIGRAVKEWNLPKSKWANPFKIGPTCTREESLALYEDYLTGKQDLLDALPELEGKVLACWCVPLPCHGDILKRLVEGERF